MALKDIVQRGSVQAGDVANLLPEEFPALVQASPGSVPATAKGESQPSRVSNSELSRLIGMDRLDNMTRPYALPSRGINYKGMLDGGMITISPIRGEIEELMAGAGEGIQAMGVFRHAIKKVMNWEGVLPYDEMLVTDWVAAFFNIIAFSYGDELVLTPQCPSPQCGFNNKAVVTLDSLACVDVADMTSEQKARYTEPFVTDPLPVSGFRVEFRSLRLKDLKASEDFSLRLNRRETQHDADEPKGDPLRTFMVARHIRKINGYDAPWDIALQFAKKAVARDLRDLSVAIQSRDTGYDLNPEFTCSRCGHRFRRRLPIDFSFFRGASA